MVYRSQLLNGFCHGDDFVIAAAEDQVECLGKLLQRKFETIRFGMKSAAEHLDKELEVLHRCVRVISSELMEIEADQRHLPWLLEDLELIRGNLVNTPRVKLSAIEAEGIENNPNLKGEQATKFRSRCAYPVQDRVDISEAIKCLSQALSQPKAGHMTQLKTSGEALERSAKKSTAAFRARAKQSAVGSARGQRLGWRPSIASKHIWRDPAARKTLAQTVLQCTTSLDSVC